jgi:rSAM/selenodomain-associated transferase 2
VNPHADRPPPAVSVIVPALNESSALGPTLDALAKVRGAVEVMVVDGGSTDGTPELARARGVRVLASERGRGVQLHAGARAAVAQVLWFVHADTLVPADAADRIQAALADPTAVGGYFRLRFDGKLRAARFHTALQPLFNALGLVYGDAAIFVRRDAYERVGGFRPYPLFEDLDLVRRLRRLGRLVRVPAEVVASSRRFEGRSYALTLTQWVGLQLLFWLGMSPDRLARLYAPIRGRGKPQQESQAG